MTDKEKEIMKDVVGYIAQCSKQINYKTELKPFYLKKKKWFLKPLC